jgi:hypothetical protein
LPAFGSIRFFDIGSGDSRFGPFFPVPAAGNWSSGTGDCGSHCPCSPVKIYPAGIRIKKTLFKQIRFQDQIQISVGFQIREGFQVSRKYQLMALKGA